MHEEKKYRPAPGWMPLAMFAGVLLAGLVLLFITLMNARFIDGLLTGIGVLSSIAMIISGLIGLCGLIAIAPNEARVLLLFGDYKGTVVESGFLGQSVLYKEENLAANSEFRNGFDKSS